MNNKRKIIIIGSIITLIFFISIIIVMSFNNTSKKTSKTVEITNLETCSKDIKDDISVYLSQSIYNNVYKLNEYNKLKSKIFYSGIVRNKSCTTRIVNNNPKIYQSSMIIDIAEAKQSWNIKYQWATKSTTLQYANADLGDITFSCLEKNELIYGDFNCKNGYNKKISNKLPIEQYLPYSDEYFQMNIITENDKKILYVIPFFDYKDFTTDGTLKPDSLNQRKQEVLNWIESKGLKPNDYTIQYKEIK